MLMRLIQDRDTNLTRIESNYIPSHHVPSHHIPPDCAHINYTQLGSRGRPPWRPSIFCSDETLPLVTGGRASGE